MEKQGYIKLYRKILDWEWFDDSSMVHLYICLILKANMQARRWHGQVVNRGQLLTSVARLHEETHIPTSTLRRCLKRLENTGEISVETTNRFSVITICNYDCYQAYEQTSGQANEQSNEQTNDKQTTNKRQTNEQQLKNDKNEKNEKKEIIKKENFSSLDSDGISSLSFENAWKMYGRKGTKSVSKSRYEKLSANEKAKVLNYIPYYLAFTLPQYRKSFEVFISRKQWENNVQDQNGRDIPYLNDETGEKAYHVANADSFKNWFNGLVKGTRIPQVETITPDRMVNINICYTNYPKEMEVAMKIILTSSYYAEMVQKGMVTFDYIFNPTNILKICEKGGFE